MQEVGAGWRGLEDLGAKEWRAEQSPPLWHQDTPLLVADTPPALGQPVAVAAGLPAGRDGQAGSGLAVGFLQRLGPGLLAQQGSQGKAAAIPRGWGR